MAKRFNARRSNNSFDQRDSLDYNLQCSTERIYSQLNKGTDESVYVSRYLKTVVEHLQEIISTNPQATNEEIKDILFSEIDEYAKTVYENAYVFEQYIEYICCQYMGQHPDKYNDISKKLIDSDLDFESLNFQDCRNFDEYLLLYTYRKKRELFDQIFEKLVPPIPSTPDNYKRFDELLQENIGRASANYFGYWFELPEVSNVFTSSDPIQKKKEQLKKYSTWYRNPKDKADFMQYSNVFLHGSYSYVSRDLPYVEREIQKDIARATSRTVQQLDNLGHLDTYMADFVFEMSRMEYPEFASIVCDNGFPTKDFTDSVVQLSKDILDLEQQQSTLSDDAEKDKISRKLSYLKRSLNKKKSEIYQHLDKDKLKSVLSENYLNNAKSVSIQNLLALNAFWANRYIKELDLYSESMFAVHKFDLISKLRNNESVNIDDIDIFNMLIQMDTFYGPANRFLQQQQDSIDRSSSNSDDTKYEEGDVEEKIIRFSYKPFIDDVSRKFGATPYRAEFSKTLPNIEHNLSEDADWYIRLYNPVFSSYLMKDEMLNVLLLSIDNPEFTDFPNAGIMLEDYTGKSLESPDGTSASIPYVPVIGIDAGLSFPVRVHAKKNVMIDFLKSFKGNAIVPVYEGSSDFHSPYRNDKQMPAPLVVPINEKLKTLFKKGIKKKENENPNSQDYHPYPRFVSHLAFQSSKKVPYHLQSFSGKGKSKSTFVRRYIDLESGSMYYKVNGQYIPIDPKPISVPRQGDDEYEL